MQSCENRIVVVVVLCGRVRTVLLLLLFVQSCENRIVVVALCGRVRTVLLLLFCAVV